MVQFKNVTKIYDKRIIAINEVSFSVKEGEFVFLIGPSGSGKSTLVKLLVRDETPTAGNVYFNDKDISRIRRSKVYKIRREIGVIFQDFKLIQDKTAYENIAFAMEVAGKKTNEIKETVPYVLDIVGLSQRMNAFPRQLSGGEQQRVAIARALSNNPKVVIADEPTGNLDPGSAWDIIQILTKINQWGTTVIMSTHGTDIVNTLGKRVIQLDKGRIIRDDNAGKYEIVKEVEPDLSQSIEKAIEKKSGPIKISLKNGTKKQQEPVTTDEKIFEQDESQRVLESGQKKKLSFFDIFRLFRKDKNKNNIEDGLNSAQSLDSDTRLHLDLKDFSNDKESDEIETIKDSQTTKKDKKKFQQISSDEKKDKAGKFARITESDDESTRFDHTPLKKLGLSSKTYKILKKAGFKTVEQVIEVGPEGLENIVDLTPENIIYIAKKITDFTNA